MSKIHSRLLADTPARDDSFGSHSKIATALFSIIDGESGGRTIGLEGDWGSGKSTVIRQLSDKASRKNDWMVQIFDAWAHQGDPLRRAFLASLIDQMLARDWLGVPGETREQAAARWKEENDRLARKLKESTKTNTPVFSNLGKLVIGLLFLIPLGNALLSASSRVGGFDQSPALFSAGVILTLAPFLAVLVSVLIARLRGKSTDDIWALFVQKTSTVEQSRSIETPEPTTIEFQNAFKVVLSEALEKNEKRRLVLVLDNLDRMSAEETSGIWSMLRSFIDNAEFTKAAWFKQLWVVIPFSASGMSATNKSGDEASAQRTFLEKVIQVKFYVPKPVLSDWKAFLDTKLADAFPSQETSHEFYKIYRLWTVYTKQNAPRPRDLISFVNEIVATNLQWNKEIPLSHQALYVLLKRNGVDVVKEMLERSLPTNLDRQLLDGDIEVSLASLAFNVEQEKARQILLGSKLEEALSDRTGSVLSEAFKGSTGFKEMLDDKLRDALLSRSTEEPNAFATALVAIANSEILRNTEPGRQTQLQRSVSAAVANMPYWPLHEDKCLDAIHGFMAIEPTESGRKLFAQGLLKTSFWYEANFDRIVPDIRNRRSLDSFILHTQKTLHDQTVGDYLREEGGVPLMRIGGTLETWFLFCEALIDQNLEAQKDVFVSAHSAESIQLAIDTAISSSRFTKGQFAALSTPPIHASAMGRLATEGLVRAKLMTGPPLPADEIYYLYRTLLVGARGRGESPSALQEIATSGWTHHHLQSAFASDSPRFIALVMYVLLKFNPSGAFSSNVGNGNAGHNSATAFFNAPAQQPQLITELCSLIEEFSDYELPFAICELNTVTRPVAFAMLNELVKIDEFLVSFADAAVSPKIGILREALPIEDLHESTKSIVGRLMRLKGLASTVSTGEFYVDQCLLYFYMAINRAFENPQFLTWAGRNLRKLDEVTVLNSIIESGWLARFIVSASENGTSIKLTRKYADAIVSFVKLMAKGEGLKSDFPKSRTHYMAAIADELLPSVRDQIYELATQQAALGLHANFFSTFGADLFSTTVFADPMNKAYRRLVIPLVKAKNGHGMESFIDAISRDSGILTSASIDNIRELNDALSLVEETSDAYPQAASLSTIIKEFFPNVDDEPQSAD